MGLLYEATCSHCKHLDGCITCGVCKITDHKVVKFEDNNFAEQCDYYVNKYYEVDLLTDEQLEIRRKVIDEIIGWFEAESFTVGRTESTPSAKMIIEHLKNMKQQPHHPPDGDTLVKR